MEIKRLIVAALLTSAAAPAQFWGGRTDMNAAAPLQWDTSTRRLSCPSCSTAAAPQYADNAVISGGSVAYVSGLSFTVAAAVYTINGVQYSSPLTTLTLGAADAANPRIDGIALTTSGTAVVVPGTADANPINPTTDPATQLPLTFRYIPALATTPANTSATLVYDEDTGPATEWTTTESTAGARIALASTANPYTGTKDIQATAAVTNDYVQFAAAAPITPGAYNSLVLYIRSKATWPSKRSLQLYFATTGTRTGQLVTLKEGAFGLQTATTSAYQQIVIPMGLFAVSGTANQLVVQVAGSGTALGFYLDAITLQTGVAPQSGVMRGLVFNFDGGGAALTPGKTLYLRPPFACTISDLSIMSTTAETVTLKFWLVSGGTAIPTAANSINSSGVSLSTGTAMRTTVLTDFTTTAVPQDAWMAATLTAVTASQNVSATLGCRQ